MIPLRSGLCQLSAATRPAVSPLYFRLRDHEEWVGRTCFQDRSDCPPGWFFFFCREDATLLDDVDYLRALSKSPVTHRVGRDSDHCPKNLITGRARQCAVCGRMNDHVSVFRVGVWRDSVIRSSLKTGFPGRTSALVLGLMIIGRIVRGCKAPRRERSESPSGAWASCALSVTENLI